MGKNNQPRVIIIAGPNGAGKSTSAPFILKEILDIPEFVNADVIASGLSGFNPEGAAITAGRIMLSKIKEYARQKKSFAFESTLSGKSYVPFLRQLKTKGYQVHIYYFWLKNPDLAVQRVKTRVKAGGHNIPESTVIQRYYKSLRNFFGVYGKICDFWQLLDNSSNNGPALIAKGNAKIHIIDNALWKGIQEFLENRQ